MINSYKKTKQFIRRLLSVKNIREGNAVKTQFEILGIKFKFHNKYKTLLNEIHDLNIKSDQLSDFIVKTTIGNIEIPENVNDTEISTENKNENIFSSLKALGKFYFLPNKGNLGDIMIASAEYQYFDVNNFEYEIYDMLDQDNYTQPFNLVYGGGGIWNKVYYREHPEILNIFRSDLLKKCVILPSSFNECDNAINTFDERFTVFCRDERSYDHCRSLNSKANFIIADDMVIGADFDMYGVPFFNYGNIKTFMDNICSYDPKKIMALYQLYCSEKSEVMKQLKTMENYNTGFLLRGDNEQDIQLNSVGRTIDLSTYLCGYGCDKGYSYICAKFFLEMINKFNIIVTNRLHIGICAAKLGKEVLLLDISSYPKVRGVYDLSLYKFKNVHMTTPEKLKEDLSMLSGKKILQNKKDNFAVDTFKDFILQYASFKNEYGIEKRFLSIRPK